MDWKLMSDFLKNERYMNTVTYTEMLKQFEIEFESKNYGAHLIVEGKFDFWPSTGLFINRTTKERGRGIFNLFKIIKKGR